jgi:hypothetical protein
MLFFWTNFKLIKYRSATDILVGEQVMNFSRNQNKKLMANKLIGSGEKFRGCLHPVTKVVTSDVRMLIKRTKHE